MKNFKHFFTEKKEKRRLDSTCWKGYRKSGTKLKGGVRVNNCVKVNEDTSDRPILKIIEPVTIDGIGIISAKVDTGNEAYNVLHGVNLKINNDKTVTFKTVDNKTVTKPIEDTINIHIGSGVKEERPVIKLDIEIKGRSFEGTPFSVADRSENTEPILIGEPFLKGIRALVDATSGDDR